MKKMCARCQQEKELSDFRKDKSRKDGVMSSCKQCMRQFYRSQYTIAYGDKYAVANKERRANQAAMLKEYKSKLKCLLCEERESICLEFHHTDPTTKEFGVGASMGRNWETIVQEIEKCVCLCSNCHKKVHAGLLVIQ